MLKILLIKTKYTANKMPQFQIITNLEFDRLFI